MSETEPYLALPGAAPAPGIVLLPPIFGVEPVIRALADRWAARGFVVVVPNQFRRDADQDVLDRTDEGRARAQARARRVDPEQITDDVRATIDSLRAMRECNGRIAVAGFCFGGRYAFLSAARLDVEAAAGFHPTQIPLSLAGARNVHVPLQLHFGAADPLTPPNDVEAISAALHGNRDAEIFLYPGAAHNFMLPGVPGYDADAASLAEQRAFALFDRLKG
jgi:carboxymethylenebutenolidase